jgi:hypothetical protein
VRPIGTLPAVKKGSGSRHRPLSWRRLSTKINAVVDQRGLPVCVVLTPGQASDKAAVPQLIDGLRLGRSVVADRGHDSRAIVECQSAGDLHP